MKKNLTVFFSCLMFLVSLSQVVFSQEKSIITGLVTDENGSTLPGANVLIKGTYIGTATDINGLYTLSIPDAGSYTLQFSYIGFDDVEKEIKITGGQKLTINMKLKPGSILGNEVTVTAQVLGQTKAINQQLKSDAIANVVSSDRIQEIPDVNAAEAIARLPGIAINRSGGEGQKIVIRGMEPKFSEITINGVRLPANSSSDRSVDLSLITPEMLDGIEVFKSPTPDMDAESVGGVVNLKLKKAPKQRRLLFKSLGGYNDLNADWKDYKFVLQGSNRFLNNKLGLVGQGTVERFNRGGDIISYGWRQGATDSETGITDILGSSLGLQDQEEIRRRWNGNLNIDYDLAPGHSISFLTLYSRTSSNKYSRQEVYNPSSPVVSFNTEDEKTHLDLMSFSLTGDHVLGKLTADWTLSYSRSKDRSPYDFNMRFETSNNPFSVDVDEDGDPRTFSDYATIDFNKVWLRGNNWTVTETEEKTKTALVNFKLPIKIDDIVSGYLKFGGKYNSTDRTRINHLLNEDWYYLGGTFTTAAAAAYDGDLIYMANTNNIISIESFLQDGEIRFNPSKSVKQKLAANVDESLVKKWANAQHDLLHNDRTALVDNYDVNESVTAGYVMLKLDFFKEKLTVIPGFRYEYSDNQYEGTISSLSGHYGVNGTTIDTIAHQSYGVFLPHLHVKIKPWDWFDIRASYSHTLARPDYGYITPRAKISVESATISDAGNPNLKYAESENFDLFFTAYQGGLGLLSFGVFHKNISNIFYPWETQLIDASTATEYGWTGYSGYRLNTYVNSKNSKVDGFEVDLQGNFSFLPKPFNGIVYNANYSRLHSTTDVFFLTSETTLISTRPPRTQTTYTTLDRTVKMPSQAPNILHLSIGYDINKFSARISGIYQGTKAKTYSSNKDFDTYDKRFWRWDASVKQRIGDKWSVFVNLNNFTNQKDIQFVRNTSYTSNIETYGFTANAGIQLTF